MTNIKNLTLFRAAELLSRGDVSSLELTRAYLERIDKTDRELGAFITVDREGALRSAAESDERRAKGESRGLFDGIPYSLKDNICTRGIETTCASKMLSGYIPPYDATVAAKLKRSGAVLLGKNNMDEFGMGSDSINSAFKICKNPQDPERVAGGSSGGSAVSVADGTSVFSLGSDTGGSVRLPASHCGVVGLKPTYSAVSRYGLIAYASSLDTIGTFCKNTADTRAVFELLRGCDPLDSTSTDFCAREEKTIVKGLRIALLRELFENGVSPEVKAAVNYAVTALRDSGACVEEVSIPQIKKSAAAYGVISAAEASSNLGRYDGIRFGHRSVGEAGSAGELISKSRGEGFGREVKRRILMGTYFLSEGYEACYKAALSARAAIIREYKTVFESFDAIISPVSTKTARRFDESVSKSEGLRDDEFCVCANLTGMPAISVPCPWTVGMPVGVQLTASYGREDILFALSEAIERGE